MEERRIPETLEEAYGLRDSAGSLQERDFYQEQVYALRREEYRSRGIRTEISSRRRERQSAVYEFEAGQQTLHQAGDASLRPFLATADAAWAPLRDAAGAGQAAPLFTASERLLVVMDAVTEHCSRIT